MSISHARRRIGIAGATAALLTSAALGMGAAAPSAAHADEAAEAPASGEATFADVGGEPPATGEGQAAGEGVSADSSEGVPAPTEAAPADATVAVGVPGTYAASEAQAALDRINAIRAEAAAEGISVDGAPVSGAPLLQSSGLEYAAQVRTAECSFSPCAAAEGLRPNGQGSVTVANPSANSLAGYAVKAEFAGQGSISCLVEQWYQEKDAYLAYLTTGEVTDEFGHYAALISDAYVYAGISSFTSSADGSAWYAVELAATPSESAEAYGDGEAIRWIDVLPEGNLDAIIILPDGIDKPVAGTVIQLAARVTNAATGADVTPYLDLTWVSNDESILSVDQNGLLTTVGEGIANIAIYQGDVALASFNLRVSPAQAVSAAVAPESANVTTSACVAPALPATAQVTWTDGSVTEEAVTWDEVDPCAYTEAGATFTVCGVTQTSCLPVSCTVTVGTASVAGLPAPTPVETASGTAPTLPQTVHVVLSDGTEADVPVVWEEVDPASYRTRTGGTFEVAGTVEGWGEPVTVSVVVQPATASGISPTSASTEAGTAPQLPATVQVTWSNGDVTDEAVSWDAVDPSAYAQAGTFAVSGTAGTDGSLGEATCSVTVTEPAPTVVGFVQPADVVTESGVAPALPATVTVTWSDGSTTDEAVTWGEVDPARYAAREGGTFWASGTVVVWPDAEAGLNVVVNPATLVAVEQPAAVSTQAGTAPTLPATVEATWSNGDVTDEAVSWDAVDPAAYAQAGTFEATGTVGSTGAAVTVEVTVAAPSVESIAQPAGVSTLAGTAPALPATVQVTWSNGDVTDEPVSWGEIDPAAYAQAGTFEVVGTLAVGDGTTVGCTVTVEASPATVESVESPSVATASGTAPALPETVEATWTDGSTTDEAVTWDAIDPASYTAREGGSFEVEGAVEGWGEPVAATVTVEPATVASVEQPAGVATASGIAPELPATVEATWSNGDTTDEAVAWEEVDPASYSMREGGSLEATGSVDGWGEQVVVQVTVEPATMASVAEVAGVATPSGTAPELPATVEATWSNGDTTDEAVAWDAIDPVSYAAREGGSFEVEGAVEGWGETVSVQVTVEPATVASVEQPAGVATASGTAPELPATTEVTWSNGDVTQEEVVWDEVDPSLYTAREGGSFEVEGAVEGWSEPVTVEVTVEPATVASVEQPANVTTASGTAPTLPATVKATWSNGDVTDETVTWGEVDPASYSMREGGSLEATGSVEGWGEPVTVEVTVEPATMASVEQPADVATASGTAPALPATVEATWSNGDTTDETVTWDEVDPASYAAREGGSFEVSGTVDGWDGPITVEVTVEAATVEALAATEASTPAGIAPKLPAAVEATWSNGDVTEETVTWDEIESASYAQPGTFAVEGAVAGTDQAATCTVAVGDPVASDIAAPDAVETYVGAEPALPATVSVSWSDGSTTDEPVAWDAVDPASYAETGTFDVAGTVGDTGSTVLAQVSVRAMRIIDVATADVSTPAGIAPELPATVEATWEDGSTTSEAVMWDAVDATSYAAQGSSFEVSGTFADSSDVADAAPAATVTVEAPAATGVAAIDPVETPAGIAPELPATASVVMSDGSTVEVDAVWNAVDPKSYRDEGSFAVEGTVGDFSASVTVDVSAPLAVNAQDVSVTTTAGTAPELPATVQVTWSNSTVTSESVSWPSYDESWYEDPGMFRVSGTAAGLDVVASVTVRTENLGIDQSGDGSATAAVAVGAGAVGIAAVAGAISALVARFRKKP